jgi:plasmid maintenance system antidote protein VapI
MKISPVFCSFQKPYNRRFAVATATPSFGKSNVERMVNPDRILLFIKETGITRTDFAHALDYNHLIMNKIIIGQRKLPENVIADFAKKIGIPIEWFTKDSLKEEPFPKINVAELKQIIKETKHAKTKPAKSRPVKTKPLKGIVVQDPLAIEILKSATAEHNIDEKTFFLALGCGKKGLQEKLTGETEIFAQDIFVLSRLCKTNLFDKFRIAEIPPSVRESDILSCKDKICAELSKTRLNRNIRDLLLEKDVSIKTAAEATGITNSRLNSMVYTHGKCYVKDLFALAKYFDKPSLELFL